MRREFVIFKGKQIVGRFEYMVDAKKEVERLKGINRRARFVIAAVYPYISREFGIAV